MEFKSHYNARPSMGKVFTKPSLTIPDQAMPISEILRRFAHGLPLSGEKVPLYDGGEDDLPDFQNMELTDRMDAIAAAKSELNEIRTKKRKPKNEAETPPKADPPKEDAAPTS